MEYKIPESSFINPPHKIEGKMEKARESFYELAKDKIRYFNHQQFIDWVSEIVDKETAVVYKNSGALVVIKSEKNEEDQKKYVTNLEIAVDTSKLNFNGENYEDILPFVIEHEIYESWIRSKKGFIEEKEFSEESRNRAHRLAMRREFLLAEKAGKGDRMFAWRMAMRPKKEKDYMAAWENAKKKLYEK